VKAGLRRAFWILVAVIVVAAFGAFVIWVLPLAGAPA
jgi:hypothetical protein